MALDTIRVRGAREHNLKNVSVDLPRDKLIVFTGLSGSGKSSLAFDTIYAEGQRRYVESLSAYARQFLELMSKPDMDSIEGLSPAISIEQKTTSKNPRSTVGTVTEIYDYMRLLWARVGVPYSPATGLPIRSQTVSQMVDKLMALDDGARLYLLAPVVRGRKGEYRKEFAEWLKAGFQRVKVNGEFYTLEEAPVLDKKFKHDIDVVVDRLVIKPGLEDRLADSLETALRLADGLAVAEFADKSDDDSPAERLIFSQKFACPVSGFTIAEIEPRLFSFNNPFGACPACDGLGQSLKFDEDLVAPDRDKSLTNGAIAPWSRATSKLYQQTLQALATHFGGDMFKPWRELPEDFRKVILYGTKDDITFVYEDGLRKFETKKPFEGVIPNLERRWRETDSSWVREDLGRFQSSQPCETCHGRRLKPEALCVKIADHDIAQAGTMPIQVARDWFGTLEAGMSPKDQQIAERILKEIRERLKFLVDVGLDYLTLDRASGTLSGGESQRIREASLTGQYLRGTRRIEIPVKRRKINKKRVVRVVDATGNNLKNISADFPLGVMTCVTGVSGGGKSTLTIETLYKAAARKLNKAQTVPGPHERVEGLDQLDKIIDIDQSPIGRTPRSNPATYTGAFTPIREWFAQLPDSKTRGYKPGRFSFNVKGGRCEACQGDGVVKIEMHFLPDVYVPCDVCHGARFNRETLEVKFKGKSIADVLDMTVEEGADFFKAVPAVRDKMETLKRVGLGYIKIGQPATQLSGGEAQRVKLSKELAKRATGKTLYILDEPTTGLHFEDIRKLLEVLHELVETGNTVVVIEHNLDVIKTADWLIDLGPEGGDGGGEIVAIGTPEDVAKVEASWTGRYLAPMLAKETARRKMAAV